MSFFTHLSIRAFVGRRSRVRLGRQQWGSLIVELEHRAGGVRESGAFLLASRSGPPTKVKRIVYFDEVDPNCLTGGISMSSSGFSALWRICSDERLRVIADIHTHPGADVRQSPDIDALNPMVAVAGHVAVIIPDLGRHAIAPDECGVHVYRGSHQWASSFKGEAARLLYVGRWP